MLFIVTTAQLSGSPSLSKSNVSRSASAAQMSCARRSRSMRSARMSFVMVPPRSDQPGAEPRSRRWWTRRRHEPDPGHECSTCVTGSAVPRTEQRAEPAVIEAAQFLDLTAQADGLDFGQALRGAQLLEFVVLSCDFLRVVRADVVGVVVRQRRSVVHNRGGTDVLAGDGIGHELSDD